MVPSASSNTLCLEHHWAFGMLLKLSQQPSCVYDKQTEMAIRNGWEDPPAGWKGTVSPNTTGSRTFTQDNTAQPTVEHAEHAEHVTPPKKVFYDPDDVFGSSHAFDTAAQKRGSALFDLEAGEDSARVFLKTPADFNKYAANMKDKRPLLQFTRRMRRFDPDVDLDLRLQKRRESIVRMKRFSHKSQHFEPEEKKDDSEDDSHSDQDHHSGYLKKGHSEKQHLDEFDASDDETDSDQDYHTGYLKEGRSNKQKRDQVDTREIRVLDDETFTWWW